MIVFLVTGRHAYTFRSIEGKQTGVTVQLMPYDQMPKLRSVPRARYVFTDLDRLPTETLRLAATTYRGLREQGLTVLNDPARVLSRYGLLRALFVAGLNRFNAYRVEEAAEPARWPVFLRTEGDHDGPMPELFETPGELKRGIESAVSRGVPVCRLLIVEYAAEPVQPGLFRKLSSFRVGQRSFAHCCVHDSQWIAKNGQMGIATPAMYEDELRIVRDDPYGPTIAKAFDLAGLDYGRADFGLVNGEVQVYEINSNPSIGFGEDHPSPARRQSYQTFKQNYVDALRALDAPGGAR